MFDKFNPVDSRLSSLKPPRSLKNGQVVGLSIYTCATRVVSVVMSIKAISIH